MTETEKAFHDGWEQAQKQFILAISLVHASGEALERYQRLVLAAVTATPCPVAPAAVDDKRAAIANERFEALRARLRPPTVHDREREPGEDDDDMYGDHP